MTRDNDNGAGDTPALRIQGALATITLQRPRHRNRLQHEDLEALLRHFEQIERAVDVRVLVFTSTTTDGRPVFCAGYDIGAFAQGRDARLFERVADALCELRPVTVCVMNGSVYGGACDLVLGCDLRVALADVELRMTASAIGLHYYPSGLQRLVARLGIAGAQRAFLTARPFSAQRLAQMGLVESVAATTGELQAQADELVADICRLGPLALETTKRSLLEISSGRADLEAMRARERQTQGSEDFAEGRAAFAQRRAPRFLRR